MSEEIDWKEPFFVLSAEVIKLREENYELKAKLGKKRIPPRGALVRDKKDGRIFYSSGALSAGFLGVFCCKDHKHVLDRTIVDWEEIEIKVKE